MSKYRDDLEAAQNRIRDLEDKVRDLSGGGAPAPPAAPTPPPREPRARRHRKGSAAAGCGGLGGLLFFIFAIIMGGPRACIACNGDVTDPALAALNNCPPAKEALGDDIGWSMIGCSNYKSRSGGDPLNQGCHSSASYNSPVSGTKARGTYYFSSRATPGEDSKFSGGTLWVPGNKHIVINADGTCRAL